MDEIRSCMVALTEGFHGISKEYLWDCVVISAADAEQKEGFELQLKLKKTNQEIPSCIKYLVIADPPGPPVGSGGATFHVLRILHSIYGNELFGKKILLVHAGGSSKRLPNFTCTGKIFCSLPMECGGRLCSILSVKFIITSPFVKLMTNGGLFVAGSDDIETYSLEGFDDLAPSINGSGVVAVAHPSSITIGSTHGVYVLPSHPQTGIACWLSDCFEVLQKPSHSTMKKRGALLSGNVGEERVYTDGMFWCGPALVKQMVAFAEECDELYREESCIYGDFLACMGTLPVEEKMYCRETSIASTLKRNISSRFQSTRLEVVVLERSHFYHLGTMPEYVENLQPCASLFQTFGMKSFVRCQGLENLCGAQGIAINSVFKAKVDLKEETVVDDCIIAIPLVCEKRVILSCCQLGDPEVGVIPAGWLFHTAALMIDGNVLYVTVAFLVDDDLKGSLGQSRSWKHVADVEAQHTSVWEAPLFEAKPTMSQSFTATWKSVTRNGQHDSDNHVRRFSMKDIIKLKHIPAMLQHSQNINRLRETS